MTDFVSKVKEFNQIAGTKEEFNPRKTCLYTGLVLEEVAELVDSYGDRALDSFVESLVAQANLFKSGHYDSLTKNMDRVNAVKEAIDIAVVAVGQVIALGGDVTGAANCVADNNLEKFPLIDGQRVVIKDANGKVKKPDGYKPADVTQFMR